jgi:hypothetical protein
MPLKVKGYDQRDEHVVYAFVVCPTCHFPAVLLLAPGPDTRAANIWFGTPASLQEIDACEVSGWEPLTSFPKYEEKNAPLHTPPEIARLYKQAASANARQEFEAAGFLYGKVLENSIKQLDSDISGTLAKRIDTLAEKGILSPDVKNWAHEIRIIRNDAVHDVEQMTPGDVKAIAEFTEAFLMVVYTMHEKYKARQSKRTAQRAQPG